MPEHILFNSAEKILLKLGSYALQQFGLKWGVRTELLKLENTISAVRSVLPIAQERQVRNHAVRQWLERLKDILYEVDNLMDEFATEDLQRQVKIQGSMIRKVCYFFTHSNPLKFRYSVGHRIKDIGEKLDDIAADMICFDFTIKLREEKETDYALETTSLVLSWDVVGRESDKEAIIQLLMSSTTDVENHVSIIPMVGSRGVGKTTLAQLVYNDDRIVSQFDQRLWVSVSDDFDIKRIIAKIVEVATCKDCSNLSFGSLIYTLQQLLGDRKFFLVLDDVWNEDRVKWIKLRDLLVVGARGSRIVVTTRSERVAFFMGTVPSYKLEGLSDDDCLSILVKMAFEEGDERRHQDLVEIGREIAKKCRGVPLVAKTLGALLHLNTDKSYWLSLGDKEVGESEQKETDILPVLKLSNDILPSHLKEWFAYCSLFVKGQEINKWSLIYLWMAQGLIQSAEHNAKFEDIGEHYFNELVRRSFLRNVEFKEETYAMHDLIHDLALHVAGMEYLTVNSNATFISEGVRHVSSSLSVLSQRLHEVKQLHTFKELPNASQPGNQSSFQALISSSTYLRVLDLEGFDYVEVPSSIGNLKHLRYLRVRGFSNLTVLPNSIGRLLNLQYLDLNCPELFEFQKLSELPKDLGNLTSLRYLSLSLRCCLREKVLIGLRYLRTLSISNFTLTSLPEDIGHLPRLRNLHINLCEQLTSLPSALGYLTALEKLEIRYCYALNFSENDLQGLTRLKFLDLRGLPRLVSLPKGLQDAAATLNHIAIWHCPNLTTLSESCGNLTSLQSLGIYRCPKLLSLPEGMYHLSALSFLEIYKCPDLSTRCERAKGADWPKIAHVPHIYIDNSGIIRCQDAVMSLVGHEISSNFVSVFPVQSRSDVRLH